MFVWSGIMNLSLWHSIILFLVWKDPLIRQNSNAIISCWWLANINARISHSRAHCNGTLAHWNVRMQYYISSSTSCTNLSGLSAADYGWLYVSKRIVFCECCSVCWTFLIKFQPQRRARHPSARPPEYMNNIIRLNDRAELDAWRKVPLCRSWAHLTACVPCTMNARTTYCIHCGVFGSNFGSCVYIQHCPFKLIQ